MRTSLAIASIILLSGNGLASGGARAQTPLDYIQPVPPQSVQLVQQRLRHDGFYGGPTDGIWGPASRAGLERFQAAHQLQVTGSLNQATLAMLDLNPAAVLETQPGVAQTEVSGEALRPAAVRAVQARLRTLGYYGGALDGVWGPATQTAIQQFQQGRGLQTNGQLNTATVAALGLTPQVLAAR